MKRWKVTLIRTAEIEAETRREAIDTAIQEHGLELGADAVEARKIR